MTNRTTLVAMSFLAALYLLTIGAPNASADLMQFQLTAPNQAIQAYAGPYANVSVDRTSLTTAIVTFTSLTSNGDIYLFGGQGSVAVNVNASSWSLGQAISGSNSGTGFKSGQYSNGGSGNEDGKGSFNQTIDSFDGFGHSSNTISFELTDKSGTWATAADVLTNNASGFAAAAHIFVTTDPAKANGKGALATGYAAGAGVHHDDPPVPDGGTTAILLGGCLVGLETLRRKLRA